MYTTRVKGLFAHVDLQWLRRAVLTRGVVALAIWWAFSGYNESNVTFAQAVSASDLREIKDLNSFHVRVFFSGGGFANPFYYSFSISGDGRFEYNGHEGAFIRGLHRSQLSAAEVRELLDAIRAADFHSLKDESTRLVIMDGGSKAIEVSVDGHSRTVTDRLGESKVFAVLFDRMVEISHARSWFEETPDTLKAVLADKEDLNSTDVEACCARSGWRRCPELSFRP